MDRRVRDDRRVNAKPPSTSAAQARLPLPLAAAFAASGAAALIHEVAAARYLSIPLGADAPAVAAVLSALLLGFALGGVAAAAALARGLEARRAAVVVEALLAVCALLALWVFPSLAPLIALGARALGLGSGELTIFRFGVALAACLPAALLMGATFPIALRLARASGLEGGAAPAAAYASNTFGAAAGAGACGFLFLPFAGYPGAVFAGAALSVASAAMIYFFAAPSSALDESPARRTGVAPWNVIGSTFFAGAAAFALEVLLTRSAVTVFGASTYAFTSVLLAFLLGLALGAPIARRASGDPERARRALAIALCAAAALTVASVYGFRAYLGLDDPFRASNRFPSLAQPWLLPVYQAVVSMLLLTPPAAALGAAFPLAVAAARGQGADADRAAGIVYAANTIGCLAGTLIATFILLPRIGTRFGVGVAVDALVVAGYLAALPRAGWTLLAAPLGIFLLFTRTAPPPGVTPLFHREGSTSTVSVDQVVGADGRDMRTISVSGTVVATEGLLDLRLQRLLGHLPALLHPKPSRTLVIGLGSGVTAGALAVTPGVESTQIVELEPFVVEAAKLFERSNYGVASGALPGVSIAIGDGRTHLLSNPQAYDVVTCDPIHPWVAGAGNLYSRECFEQERRCLAPGGISALWLPLYKLRSEDLRVIARTWCDVYSATALYVTGYDAILLGGNGSLPAADAASLRERFRKVAGSLRDVEVRSVEELLSGLALGDADLRAFAGSAPMNTDARPILEYRAPLLYLTDYAVEFLDWVRARRAEPESCFGPNLKMDAAALDRGSRLRSRAVERFLAGLKTSVARGIADASAVFREPRS